jgi:hypothetical protein
VEDSALTAIPALSPNQAPEAFGQERQRAERAGPGEAVDSLTSRSHNAAYPGNVTVPVLVRCEDSAAPRGFAQRRFGRWR